MTRNETTARKFNESVDYFTPCYGNPFEDCAINLLANYRDMKSVNEDWANATIAKTIKRMPKSIIKDVMLCVNSADNHKKFDIFTGTAVFNRLRNECSDRGIFL